MSKIKREICQFFRFILNPFLIKYSPARTSLLRSLYFAALTVGVGFLLDLVGELPAIQKYFCYPKDILDNIMANHGFLYIFFTGAVAAPILEELIGRFYLNSVQGNMIYLFINLFIVVQIFYKLKQGPVIAGILLLIVFILVISILFENNILFRKRCRFL